uniref:WD_REPEATS_REGION domain-containing protein n=1 Tax=Mesocestoides corti TaxID=53468 RepID=A0A5K3EQB7_MESCO
MAASHAFCLISQARDGKIRFWDTNQLLLSTSASIKPLLEIACCDYTFCPFAVWPLKGNGACDHRLAYVTTDDGDTTALCIEVIRSPDNLIVCSVDAGHISKLGMCMALSGLPSPEGTCRFLAGFEAGCVVVFDEGRPTTRLSPTCPTDTRPITCLAASVADPQGFRVAVGKAAANDAETGLADFDLLKVTIEDSTETHLERCAKQPKSSAHGISAVCWRRDGLLVAGGQWNGDIRCFSVASQGRARCLGDLRSPGAVVGGGTLMGEWSSVSGGTQTSSGDQQQQQQSLCVRSCLFLPSNWLITTAPASAGGAGALHVWDVYRDS